MPMNVSPAVAAGLAREGINPKGGINIVSPSGGSGSSNNNQTTDSAAERAALEKQLGLKPATQQLATYDPATLTYTSTTGAKQSMALKDVPSGTIFKGAGTTALNTAIQKMSSSGNAVGYSVAENKVQDFLKNQQAIGETRDIIINTGKDVIYTQYKNPQERVAVKYTDAGITSKNELYRANPNKPVGVTNLYTIVDTRNQLRKEKDFMMNKINEWNDKFKSFSKDKINIGVDLYLAPKPSLKQKFDTLANSITNNQASFFEKQFGKDTPYKFFNENKNNVIKELYKGVSNGVVSGASDLAWLLGAVSIGANYTVGLSMSKEGRDVIVNSAKSSGEKAIQLAKYVSENPQLIGQAEELLKTSIVQGFNIAKNNPAIAAAAIGTLIGYIYSDKILFSLISRGFNVAENTIKRTNLILTERKLANTINELNNLVVKNIQVNAGIITRNGFTLTEFTNAVGKDIAEKYLSGLAIDIKKINKTMNAIRKDKLGIVRITQYTSNKMPVLMNKINSMVGKIERIKILSASDISKLSKKERKILKEFSGKKRPDLKVSGKAGEKDTIKKKVGERQTSVKLEEITHIGKDNVEKTVKSLTENRGITASGDVEIDLIKETEDYIDLRRRGKNWTEKIRINADGSFMGMVKRITKYGEVTEVYKTIGTNNGYVLRKYFDKAGNELFKITQEIKNKSNLVVNGIKYKGDINAFNKYLQNGTLDESIVSKLKQKIFLTDNKGHSLEMLSKQIGGRVTKVTPMKGNFVQIELVGGKKITTTKEYIKKAVLSNNPDAAKTKIYDYFINRKIKMLLDDYGHELHQTLRIVDPIMENINLNINSLTFKGQVKSRKTLSREKWNKRYDDFKTTVDYLLSPKVKNRLMFSALGPIPIPAGRLQVTKRYIETLRPMVKDLSGSLSDNLNFIKGNFLSSLRPNIQLSWYELNAWADYIKYLSRIKLIDKPQEIHALKSINVLREDVIMKQRMGTRKMYEQKLRQPLKEIPRGYYNIPRLRLPVLEIPKLPEKIKIPNIKIPMKYNELNKDMSKNGNTGYIVVIKAQGKYKQLKGIYSAEDARNLAAYYTDVMPTRTANIIRTVKPINRKFDNRYYEQNRNKFRNYRISSGKKTRYSDYRIIEKKRYFNDLERMKRR